MNEKISSVLKTVEKPGRYCGGEYGAIMKNKEEVKAIKDALKCGLSGGYPDETIVYYTDGAWHGYSGDLQPGKSDVFSYTTTFHC